MSARSRQVISASTSQLLSMSRPPFTLLLRACRRACGVHAFTHFSARVLETSKGEESVLLVCAEGPETTLRTMPKAGRRWGSAAGMMRWSNG